MQDNESYGSDKNSYAEKLTEWEKEPTLGDLIADFDIAKSSHDVHSAKIKKWLSLRNADKVTNSKKDKSRSTVKPKLIRRQNEWRYSALSEPFLSSEKVFSITPKSWEDVKSANQNELVLNWQFKTKMNPVKFMDEYVRTTVDEGTCIVRVGWDRETRTVKVDAPVWQYMALTDPEAIQQLQQAIELKQANPNGFLDLPEEIQESVNYSMEKGMPAIAQQVGVEEVDEEEVVTNQPSITVMDFDNVYLDPSCDGDPDKAGFAVISFETSKADLIKDGRYKNLKKVNWASNSPSQEPLHNTNGDDSVRFRDELRMRVVAHEYWGWYDINDDETLVPIVATWIGNCLIRMEENPFPDQKLPLVFVPYMPVKKSVTGEPDAELLEENQDILGAITRGMIDLMGRSANGQTGIAKGLMDPVNYKKYLAGADYNFNPGTTPANGIFQHKYPEVPQSAFQMLQLQNQEAEALSGVKAYAGGISGEAYGEVAAGIRGVLDASSKREMAILRRLAQGMSEIGIKVSQMNAVFLSETEVVRVTNAEFISVRREDLKGNFDLECDISTPEIDEAKAKDLSFMLQTMGNSMDFNMTKMILAEIARLKSMPKLSHEIKEFEQQPDPMVQQMQEMEIQKLAAEIAEIQSKVDLNSAKARAELAGADLKDLDFIEQETGTKHERDIDKVQSQAEANQKLEVTKRLLTPDEGPEEKPNKMYDVASALVYNATSDG
jgi:hypothetical protein